MQKLLCNIYIFLWCVYNLQGVLYPTGSFVSRLMLGMALSMWAYYFFLLLVHYRLPKVLKILSFLLLVWTIYGLIIIMFGNGVRWLPEYYYLKKIYISLLPVLVFYYVSKEGYLSESLLKKWTVIFVIVAIASFNSNSNARVAEDVLNREEFTNNAAYVVLSIMPLVPLFYKKPIIQYVLLGVVMLYVLLGMKRGAILCGALSSVWFLFRSFKDNNTGGKKVWKFLLTIVIIAGAVFAIRWMLSTSDYFAYRLEETKEGDSSGRDSLFDACLSFFFDQSNVFHILFGNGADATVRLFGNYAHNDWLEIAINNGLFTFVLYLVFWIVLLTTVVKTKKRNHITYMMMGIFLIVFFARTFFSMTYYSLPMFASCALGFALANSNVSQNQ